MERRPRQVVCVLTNVSHLAETKRDREPEPNERTGYDIKSVAYIQDYLHRKNQIKVIWCSPKGGPTYIDPKSLELSRDDPIVKHFLQDHSLVDSFKSTPKIDDLLNIKRDGPHEYDAILLLGNHGALIDFPESKAITKLAESVYANNGYLCTIGHGICGLLQARQIEKQGASGMASLASSGTLLSKLSEWTSMSSGNRTGGDVHEEKQGTYILSDKRVTCPMREEDEKLKITPYLPFHIEDKLKELKCKIEHAHNPFESKVVVDQRIISAQNCESVSQWVREIVRLLS